MAQAGTALLSLCSTVERLSSAARHLDESLMPRGNALFIIYNSKARWPSSHLDSTWESGTADLFLQADLVFRHWSKYLLTVR